MTITLKTPPDISEPRGRVSSGQTVKGWSEAAVIREVELQVAPLLEEIERLRRTGIFPMQGLTECDMHDDESY